MNLDNESTLPIVREGDAVVPEVQPPAAYENAPAQPEEAPVS